MEINLNYSYLPSPSGKKVLNPRISLLYPLNKFFTRSITPGVFILHREMERRNGEEKWRGETEKRK
jgi:hypothetical protein